MNRLFFDFGKPLGAIATAILAWTFVSSIPVQSRSLSNSSTSPNQTTTLANRDETPHDIYTQFAFKLFSTIHQQQSQENIFISPASITNALAMTYNGAAGTTQEAMAESLEIQGMSLEEFNQANAAVKALLSDDHEAVEIRIANSLWLNQTASFLPSFLQQVTEFYQAQLNRLDFGSPTAADEINAWVREQTNDKIKGIIDSINPQSILYLMNAIYFKGSWRESFAEELTEERPFHLMDGTTRPHPLMLQYGRYMYLENSEVQAISLPYGNGRFSLYVLLPRETVNLTRFYQELNAEQWNDWINAMELQEGTIRFPRFQLDYSIALTDTLEQMGMGIAFSPNQADFSKMTSENVHISEVQHKTFLELNEEGTTAAAVTSVDIVRVSLEEMPELEPFYMIVDRPFFMAIRDNPTQTILFMGSIVNPATSN